MREENEQKRFTPREVVGELGENWKKRVRDDESEHKYVDSRGKLGSNPYLYIANRTENGSNWPEENIQSFHGESIIDNVIPKLIKKFPNQKIKILDVGAGACFFVDQIRQKFGDRVDVYSTGLSKQAARKERKNEGMEKLHPNDLKWRSIQELSDYPEFHLIIDTYGESYYGTNLHLYKLRSPKTPECDCDSSNPLEWYTHIRRVVKKLLPGGYATIYPVNCVNEDEKKEVIKKIANELNVNVYFGEHKPNCLKIEKK